MKIQQLDEKRIREEGWNDIYIKGASSKVHIFHYCAGKEKKNIIILHTPNCKGFHIRKYGKECGCCI